MSSISNLDYLLSLENVNESIIALDNAISEFCDYGNRLEKLTGPQKTFFYNQSLERELNNGGFEQYFRNSSGSYAHDTVNSLQLIGAHKTAEILKLAIDQFPECRVPIDRSNRVSLVEMMEGKMSKAWDELDAQFYKYEDDLNSLNLDYVKQNRMSF